MMTVNTEYDGFIAKVLITSDSGNEIDLLSREFRIDIGDRLKAMGSITDFLNNQPTDEDTDEEKQTKHAAQMELIKELSTPILQISSENYREYCNSDDESLARNGVQFWLSNDKREMSMRFIPKNIIQGEVYNFSWAALLVIVGFDFKNTVKFDLALMPRLITGPIVVAENNPYTEPVLSAASARPDYPFNGELDVDNLYLNNGDECASQHTPLYTVKSSAFMCDDLREFGADDFDWTKFRSDLYNGAAQSGIPIPYRICGSDNVEDFPRPEKQNIEMIPGIPASTLSGVYVYDIEQDIEVSAAEGRDPITFAKNSVRLSLAI